MQSYLRTSYAQIDVPIDRCLMTRTLAQAIAVLARAQQDAVWNRQHVANQLRSLLRDYFPAFLEAFQDRRPGGLAHPDARAVLAIAPTPTHAARLTRPQLVAALNAAAGAEDTLAEATRLAFQQHRDATIFTSFPGLGELPAARVLAEIGDDRARFADARGLKAYAGAAPLTRASGKELVVVHRTVKNNRLAFAAIRLSAGARAHYD